MPCFLFFVGVLFEVFGLAVKLLPLIQFEFSFDSRGRVYQIYPVTYLAIVYKTAKSYMSLMVTILINRRNIEVSIYWSISFSSCIMSLAIHYYTSTMKLCGHSDFVGKDREPSLQSNNYSKVHACKIGNSFVTFSCKLSKSYFRVSSILYRSVWTAERAEFFILDM